MRSRHQQGCSPLRAPRGGLPVLPFGSWGQQAFASSAGLAAASLPSLLHLPCVLPETESLLDQTLVAPQNSLLNEALTFGVQYPSSYPPASARAPHPPCLIALGIWLGSSPCTVSQVLSDPLGLPSAGILLGQFNKKSLLTSDVSVIFLPQPALWL